MNGCGCAAQERRFDNQAMPAPTVPEIPEQIGRARQNAEDLHAAISRLEDRLIGVLIPVPKDGVGGVTPVPSRNTPIGTEAGMTADIVSHAIGRINNLHARLEL